MYKKSSIIIITDYPDVAYNEVRGQIISKTKSRYGNDYWIEPCVQAFNFSTIHGAFLLKLLFEDYTNNGTIFVCLINPEKRNGEEQPSRLLIKLTNNRYIFCPDVGIVNWVLQGQTNYEIYELPKVSKMSFAGKYFYPKYIADLIDNKLKNKIKTYKRIEKLNESAVKDSVVVHIDNFGNLKINLPFINIKKLDNKNAVAVFSRDGIVIKKIDVLITTKRFRNFSPGKVLLYEGSSFELSEVAKVQIVNPFPEIKIGDMVSLKY